MPGEQVNVRLSPEVLRMLDDLRLRGPSPDLAAMLRAEGLRIEPRTRGEQLSLLIRNAWAVAFTGRAAPVKPPENS